MMKNLSPKSLATLPVLIALSLFSASTSAQSCDPQIRQGAEQEMAKRVEDEAKRAQAIYGGHLEQPDWMAKSNGLLTACAKGNWASFMDSIPVIAGFDAKEQAVKRACDEARKTISEGAQKYDSILNTIEGYQDRAQEVWDEWNNPNPSPTLPGVPRGNNGGNNGGGIDWGTIRDLIPGGGVNIPGISPQNPTPQNPTAPRQNPAPQNPTAPRQNPTPQNPGVPGVTPVN